MGFSRRRFLAAAALAASSPFALAGRRPEGGGLGRALREARASTVTVDQSNLPAPNILFVLVDDQPPHTVSAMEKTLGWFSGEGIPGADLTGNAYTAVPLCGPARCTLLTGRYQHSHKITGNDPAFLQYRDRYDYAPTDMLSRVGASEAGYLLGFFGKYINGYEHHNRYIHPAFAEGHMWFALADGQGKTSYEVNVNGAVRVSDQNHTPYFGGYAEVFIRNSASETRPWFCYLNWTDPHMPHLATPISGSYSSPETEEADVSDKSDYVLGRPTRGDDFHLRVYQGQGGEVERLDNRMELLFRALEETGQLDNTVVLYSSDNGFLLGEHGGLTKKALPYREVAGAPFLARGPGFAPLPDRKPLVSHVDLTASVCAVAGADTSGLEGRDLRGLWTGEPWRKRLLVERIGEEGEVWGMVREGRWSYSDFAGAVRDKELYDLSSDPYETENLLHYPTPRAAAKAAELSSRLASLQAATGEGVRAAEEAP